MNERQSWTHNINFKRHLSVTTVYSRKWMFGQTPVMICLAGTVTQSMDVLSIDTIHFWDWYRRAVCLKTTQVFDTSFLLWLSWLVYLILFSANESIILVKLWLYDISFLCLEGLLVNVWFVLYSLISLNVKQKLSMCFIVAEKHD